MQRWRAARAERDRARDALAEALLRAGERRRLSLGLRLLLAALAVLAPAGAGCLAWRAAEATPAYSDADLVSAASSRVQRLLAADAADPDRAREILAGATGDFYDSFAQSAEAYTAFVADRGTVGEAAIDGAALVTREGDGGVVLVTAGLRVGTGAAGPTTPRPTAPPQSTTTPGSTTTPQQVRLRVLVEPDDGVLKLAGVVFLP